MDAQPTPLASRRPELSRPTVDRLAEQRDRLRGRHAAALTALMEERIDLRGVHALADQLDDAVRWTA